jgi:hypothetical protein
MQQRRLPTLTVQFFGERLPIGKTASSAILSLSLLENITKIGATRLDGCDCCGEYYKRKKGLELLNKHFAGIEPVANPIIISF